MWDIEFTVLQVYKAKPVYIVIKLSYSQDLANLEWKAFLPMIRCIRPEQIRFNRSQASNLIKLDLRCLFNKHLKIRPCENQVIHSKSRHLEVQKMSLLSRINLLNVITLKSISTEEKNKSESSSKKSSKNYNASLSLMSLCIYNYFMIRILNTM